MSIRGIYFRATVYVVLLDGLLILCNLLKFCTTKLSINYTKNTYIICFKYLLLLVTYLPIFISVFLKYNFYSSKYKTTKKYK